MEAIKTTRLNATHFHRYHMIYDLLCRYLSAEKESVTVALCSYPSMEILLNAVAEKKVDIVFIDSSSLVDKSIENESVKKALSLFCASPHTTTVLFANHAEPSLFRKMQQMGIDIILNIRDRPEELVYGLAYIQQGKGCYLSAGLRSDQVTLNSKENSLTQKEWEILNMIYAGYSLSEIAARKFRAISTIATQKRNAMNKLNLKNQSELVLFMQQKNLL